MNYRQGFFSNIPPVTKNIIIINIILLIVTWFIGSAVPTERYDIFTQYLALYYPGSEYFMPHQFVTHMFMHSGFTHLLLNMFALFMFGRVLEQVWGPRRFLVFYFITGIGAAGFYVLINYFRIDNVQDELVRILNSPSPELYTEWVREYFPGYFDQVYDRLLMHWSANPDSSQYLALANEYGQQLINLRMDIPMLGASGAVYGVLLAFGVLFPNTELMLLFPPIPIKAKYLVLGLGILALYMGIANRGDGVAHFAHLGGMIFGYILIKYWSKHTRNFY
jgi:membrane associated rhomboid family serine protease